ncbi:OmpW/AlkL family protein [Geomesophilobacter sediminis]|uniref:OmpW family protein n=1 Tax=Geomesophilobacter sediminis TaxID=2798584 RepID=A0A8J7SB09_9BACT|nr:OmpW family outer membrane protein [Geomesophilobacter sediminis]MBJ6727795.1 OmpW family protein [Geomesophilobacter sediminis]
MAKKVLLAVVMAMVVTVFAGTSFAADENIGVRFRAIYVKPNEDIDGALNSLNLKIGDDIIPELDLEYFFTKKVSVEAIAGVTRHDIRSNGSIIGSTWLLPPTITVKYHPFGGSTVSPYIGAGINATFPFSSSTVLGKKADIDNTVGWAAQAGIDFKIAEHLYFNLDYKYINAESKLSIDNGTKYKLDLNPSLFAMGVGYRF